MLRLICDITWFRCLYHSSSGWFAIAHIIGIRSADAISSY